jgi:hypothetical protein
MGRFMGGECAGRISRIGCTLQQRGGQRLSRQPGPLDTRAAEEVRKGLESRAAGREAGGAVVEPRCGGMAEAIDPFDPTGDQVAPRSTRLFEHRHRMSGQPQRMRSGSPGDASAGHRNRPLFLSQHLEDCMPFWIHYEFTIGIVSELQ